MHTNSMRLETIKKESISRQSQSHETALQLYDVLFKNFLIFFSISLDSPCMIILSSLNTSINGNVKRKKCCGSSMYQYMVKEKFSWGRLLVKWVNSFTHAQLKRN